MATIKSFTSLEQSKRLTEILPLESADMKILPFTEREYRIVPINDISVCGREDEIHAWSLAALLEAMPKIHGLKPILDLEECSIQYSGIDLYITASNPVDACYEMILKLKERNLL